MLDKVVEYPSGRLRLIDIEEEVVEDDVVVVVVTIVPA